VITANVRFADCFSWRTARGYRLWLDLKLSFQKNDRRCHLNTRDVYDMVASWRDDGPKKGVSYELRYYNPRLAQLLGLGASMCYGVLRYYARLGEDAHRLGYFVQRFPFLSEKAVRSALGRLMARGLIERDDELPTYGLGPRYRWRRRTREDRAKHPTFASRSVTESDPS
jgi:hypothetical protein